MKMLDRGRTTLAECENGKFLSVDIENCNVEWSMTNKSGNKCCFSLRYCHICVSFLLWCCRVAIWPPFTFPCTRSRSTQFLSAKFLCFGFASTNHVARNHIDRNVYGPHCVKTPYGSAVNNPKAAMITAFLHVANRKNEQRGTGYCVLNGQMEQSIVDRIDRSNRKIKVAQFER